MLTTPRASLCDVCMYAGVNSVGIAGDAKDRLEVVGESVDITCMINLLRKKVCRADIVVVEEVKDKKKEEEEKKKKEEDEKKKKEKMKPFWPQYPTPPSKPAYPVHYFEDEEESDDAEEDDDMTRHVVLY